MEKIKGKDVDRAIVGTDSAFAEYPDKVDYVHGVNSASNHLGCNVLSLDSSFADIISTMTIEKSLVFSYEPNQLMVDRNPTRNAKNKTRLQILKTTTAKQMVDSGLIQAEKYAQTLKTQHDLGLIEKDDGERKRYPPGDEIDLNFIMSDRITTKDITITIPNQIHQTNDDDSSDEKIVNVADYQIKNPETGARKLKLKELPKFQSQIQRHIKRQHYWLWSRNPSVGKTHNLNILSEYAFVLRTQYQSGFWSDFDEQAQIVVIDEYGNGTGAENKSRILPISDLNQIADGHYAFNMKHKNKMKLLDKNPLLVIMTNLPPEDIYTCWDAERQKHVPHERELALLRARFHVIQIDAAAASNDKDGAVTADMDECIAVIDTLKRFDANQLSIVNKWMMETTTGC